MCVLKSEIKNTSAINFKSESGLVRFKTIEND